MEMDTFTCPPCPETAIETRLYRAPQFTVDRPPVPLF